MGLAASHPHLEYGSIAAAGGHRQTGCRHHLERRLASPVDGWFCQGCWAYWPHCVVPLLEHGMLRDGRPGPLQTVF